MSVTKHWLLGSWYPRRLIFNQRWYRSSDLVTRSLVLYVCFVDRCLSFCAFSFGHCIVCSSSIHGFWLPFWYLQTLLICNAVHILQEDVERYYKAYQNFAKAIIYSPDIVSINRNVLCICTMHIPLDHWVDTTFLLYYVFSNNFSVTNI
jgi:hypothetical protein